MPMPTDLMASETVFTSLIPSADCKALYKSLASLLGNLRPAVEILLL